ncbi:MAG TPA: hypothetical protein VE863_00490 [Pyrinomonadaceae bacterium]|nr:hypothetical protein [Pyrinomonadaceae bacterium]
MKRFITTLFMALLVGALASFSAFAAGDKDKVEKKTITFPEDVMVNGTLIKAGDYDVKFDAATNELSIIKNGKVEAKTPAHVEARSDKARNTALRTADKGGTAQLIGVTFGGSSQDVIVGASGAVSGTQ